MSDFRRRLLGGETVFGTMLTLNAPAVAEMMSEIGFDWLFIDGEHAPIEPGDLQLLLQAIGKRAAAMVRVRAADEAMIKAVLDLGADGVIVPQIDTADEAAAVVRYARYPPLGRRGVGLGRAQGYGMQFAEYLEAANEEVTVVVQAESAASVDHIDAIVQVEGIDVVLIGPYDLSASLGRMGQLDDPLVTGAIDHIAEACRKAGVPVGIFGVTPEAVKPFQERGFRFLVSGVDTLLLGQAAKQLLAELR